MTETRAIVVNGYANGSLSGHVSVTLGDVVYEQQLNPSVFSGFSSLLDAPFSPYGFITSASFTFVYTVAEVVTSVGGSNDGIIRARPKPGDFDSLFARPATAPDISISIPVTEAQYQAALIFAEANDGITNNYGLLDQNCVTFVDNVFAAAGLDTNLWRAELESQGGIPGARPIEVIIGPDTARDLQWRYLSIWELEGLSLPPESFPADTPIAISWPSRPFHDIRSMAEIEGWGVEGWSVEPWQDAYDQFQYAAPFTTPLVLDLNGDGIELTSVNGATAFFDVGVDGFAEATGWVAADDGLLVLDVNGNGRIDNGSELFGDQTGHAHGFLALAQHDDNGDGVIDASDAVFGQLRIWQDLNQDGISQARRWSRSGRSCWNRSPRQRSPCQVARREIAPLKWPNRCNASAVGVPAAVVAATFAPGATSRAVAVSSPDRAICQDTGRCARIV